MLENELNSIEFARAEAMRYRKEAEGHKEALVLFWKRFLISGLFVLAGVVLLAILVMAWFVMNNNVNGGASTVSAKEASLVDVATLKTGSRQGVYDDNTDNVSGNLATALKMEFRDKGYTSFEWLPSFIVGESTYEHDGKTYILGDSEGVSLMVNGTGNVNNDTIDRQIGPGSRGQFTFYLIPKAESLTSFTATIELCGYVVSGDGATAQVAELGDSSYESDAKQQLQNCVGGHLLLFQGLDGNGSYTNRVNPVKADNGRVTFSFTVSNASGFTKDESYPVTIYWVWPRHFEDMIYPGRSESVFAAAGSGQNAMMNWINNDSNKAMISQSAIGLPDVDVTTITNAQLMAWNMAYNQGDQLIGDRISFFNWVITATNL